MQRLEVSGAVRHIYGSLGVKLLMNMSGMNIDIKIHLEIYFMCLGKQEIYCTSNTCRIVSVLFSTK